MSVTSFLNVLAELTTAFQLSYSPVLINTETYSNHFNSTLQIV
jgi:hypothetical protein